MDNMLRNKIYIIGSVASGKTTMARKLSKHLNIPWYELDNVVHLRLPSGDVKEMLKKEILNLTKLHVLINGLLKVFIVNALIMDLKKQIQLFY